MGPDWSGQIIGSDVSPTALEVAGVNRGRLGLEGRAALVRGSLLEWLRGPVDLILANLPYLRPDQIDANSNLAAEPRLALDGGTSGLMQIEQLLDDAPRVLGPNGAIGLEIDPSQTITIKQLAEWAWQDSQTTVLRDLAGLERHVIVQTGE